LVFLVVNEGDLIDVHFCIGKHRYFAVIREADSNGTIMTLRHELCHLSRIHVQILHEDTIYFGWSRRFQPNANDMWGSCVNLGVE